MTMTINQNTRQTLVATPTLWLESAQVAENNFLDLDKLGTQFNLNLGDRLEADQQYIIVNTSERLTRQRIRDAQSVGAEIIGIASGLQLHFSFVDIVDQATKLYPEKWLEITNEQSIPIKELSGLLEDILRADLEPEQQRDEVDALRPRSGLNDYRFDKDYLEPLMAKLKLERQYRSGTGKKADKPKPSQLVKEIAEKYREKLAWNIQIREWFLYESEHEGIWAKEAKEVIEHVIKTELDDLVPDGFTYRFLCDVMNLLKGELKVKRWNQTKGLIPLRNGVLDKQTKELREHSPGYRLTHCLPFEYDPAATCQPIEQWLSETVGGKQDLVEFLLAYLNAVVNQRSDLQRYLELIGPGGTGKSTYMKLASALVGHRNTHTTKHQLLEGSRFETANLQGKLLALITEADQYVGSVNVLKAITGQDQLHYEEKMKQAGEGFIFEGLVITAGNEPSRTSDYTSGLARRKIPVWFRNFVPTSSRRDLDREFKQHLPGLLNLVLSIPDERVTELIRDAELHCPSLREYQRETLCETNPIADWVDNKIVRTPGDSCKPSLLYEDYKAYSLEMGTTPISQKRFSNLLLDLCQVQLGWSEVSKGRTRTGRFVTGLSIRAEGDFSSPFPISEISEESVTDKSVTVTDSVTAETSVVNGCDGCDGFLEESVTHENKKANEDVVKEQKNGVQSVTPVTPVTQSVTVAECLGKIEGVLWQDDFSPALKGQKLTAIRNQCGADIYNTACQKLNDEDKAELEALRAGKK